MTLKTTANLVSFHLSRESNSEFPMMNPIPIMNVVTSFVQSHEWYHSIHSGNVWSTRPNSLDKPYNSSMESDNMRKGEREMERQRRGIVEHGNRESRMNAEVRSGRGPGFPVACIPNGVVAAVAPQAAKP